MAEEKEEEYHIDDSTLSGGPEPDAQEESVELNAAEASPHEGGMPIEGMPVVYQRALAVVGMILLIFAMYKIIMWVVHLAGHKEPTSKQITQQTAAPAPVAPPAPTTFSQPQQSLDESKVNAKFTELASTQQDTQSQLQSMSSQVSNVESQLQNVNDKLNVLAASVQTLTAQLEKEQAKQALLVQAQAAKPEKPRPPRKRRHTAKQFITPYFLQAAIPGRAWLIHSDGTGTITVRVGSHVPGYGVVSQIDANAGRVQLASGRVITFERGDN